MIKVSVLYPNESGKSFDMDDFTNKHMPMVHRLLDSVGLVRTEVGKGIATVEPGAPAPLVASADLYFNSLEDLQRALGAHGGEVMGDIPNYSQVQPQVQIAEIVE